MRTRKKSRIIRLLISFIFIVIQFISLILFSYSLVIYKGVETFYRYFVILIFLYFFFFFAYLFLRSIKQKSKSSIIVPTILSFIIITISFGVFYYLTKIYSSINQYSNDENMYYSSLVTYNKELNSEKDLNKMKIGIVDDSKDIEGYILPNETISNLKLNSNNKIVKYDSTMELLHALKNKEVDAAFFSRNYVDMFYSVEGFENIEEETKVLYTASKEYKSTEEDIKSETASFNKPLSILLIGVDSSKDGVTSGYNADVLLLATFNPETLRVTLTSVPRDMYLKTACSNGKYRRINTTTWGSSSTCAVQTIENLFDVDIDYYAKINFKGVVKLVNAVGGIDVNVDYPICEQNSSRKWGKNTVYIEEGKQHLNGEQALALARNRHKPNDGSKTGANMAKYCASWTAGSRNDYTRGRNQMKVILGVVNSAMKIKDPNKIISVLDTIKSNFQTNITTKDLLNMYNLAKSIVISDSTNLVNVKRSQLAGYDAWGHVYDISSKSYPAVTIPYKGSIKDIQEEIKDNLNNKSIKAVTKISFDLNNLYEDELTGKKTYNESKIATLKNLSSYSLDSIKSYASSNGLKVKFINKDTNKEVTDLYNYKFSSQKEHVDTILDQISTLTIYVKSNVTYTQVEETTENTTE